MNGIQKNSRQIIKVTFDFSVSIIEFFSDMKKNHNQLDLIRKLPQGTVGKEIADCVDKDCLSLDPNLRATI